MSGPPTSPASGSPRSPANGPADDPLAADRRTLIIALVAMVVLVSVGIVSAAVFTGSACEAIGPSPVSASGASVEAEEVLALAFPDAEPDVVATIEAQLTALSAELGAVTGLALVDGADALAATSGGVAATGPITSMLAPSGDEITASVNVGPGVVVGSGDTLMSLARVNDLTGQVDAFATIDATATGGLTEIGCVDTATVGTPLAFELDAGDGQLLLFRVEEDGDDAELELRDPREGRLWFARVDVGMAPPGVTGERIDGRLGDEVAVLVHRTAPDEDTPLVTAVERADGALRWQVGREALRLVFAPNGSSTDGGTGSSVLRDDAAQRLEVLALDAEKLVVAITDARDEDAVVAGGTDALGPSTGPGHVVALDVRDGSPLWQRPLAGGVRVLAASSGPSAVWLVLDDGEQTRLVGLDAAGEPLGESADGIVVDVDSRAASGASGEADDPSPDHGSTAPAAAVAVLADATDASAPTVLAVLSGRLVVVRTDGEGSVADVTQVGDAGAGLRPRDVLAVGDRVYVLFAGAVSRAGPGADARDVLVTLTVGR